MTGTGATINLRGGSVSAHSSSSGEPQQIEQPRTSARLGGTTRDVRLMETPTKGTRKAEWEKVCKHSDRAHWARCLGREWQKFRKMAEVYLPESEAQCQVQIARMKAKVALDKPASAMGERELIGVIKTLMKSASTVCEIHGDAVKNLADLGPKYGGIEQSIDNLEKQTMIAVRQRNIRVAVKMAVEVVNSYAELTSNFADDLAKLAKAEAAANASEIEASKRIVQLWLQEDVTLETESYHVVRQRDGGLDETESCDAVRVHGEMGSSRKSFYSFDSADERGM
jgi:hypothetical protein